MNNVEHSEPLFRDDAYLKTCAATVVAVNDRGGIVLDRTIFYPTGGGQPGDCGGLRWDGGEATVATSVKGEAAHEIVHVVAEGETLPPIGTQVEAVLDWSHRHRLMRMHTCLHLLSSIVPYPVTGGQVGVKKGRLDFDIPEAGLDKEHIGGELERLIGLDIAVAFRWITDAELAAQPDLVKTMSVKPPVGAGLVRLVEIPGADLQPCGGTHVARTGEIGAVEVGKIEKKGRQNRRVNIRFCD